MRGERRLTCVGQGYIYVEADKEAHVKEAVSGLRDVFQSKPAKLVPLKEMVDAVSTSQKADPLIGICPFHALWCCQMCSFCHT